MSTDYTHFDKLAFNRLFALGPDGQETLMINSSGVFVGAIQSTGTESVVKILAADGTAAVPSFSFSNDQDTGLYRISSNKMGFAAGGIFVGSLDGTGQLALLDGTGGAPSYSFAGELGLGFSRDASGSVALFSADPTLARLHVRAATADASSALILNSNALGAGDQFVSCGENSSDTGAWSFGRDDSDSSAWVLSQKFSAVGTNNFIRVTTAGAITLGASSGTQSHSINGTVILSTSTDQLLRVASSGATQESAIDVQLAAGNTTGDAYSLYRISGGTSWAVGLDNSDSDKWKVSQSTGLGTNDYIAVTTAGGVSLAPVGGALGFFGVTPAAKVTTYSATNVTTDRSYDANATSVDELADVLGTLISDLRGYGLLS